MITNFILSYDKRETRFFFGSYIDHVHNIEKMKKKYLLFVISGKNLIRFGYIFWRQFLNTFSSWLFLLLYISLSLSLSLSISLSLCLLLSLSFSWHWKIVKFNTFYPLDRITILSCHHLKQELLGQFSSTVEQKLYHWEWRNNDEKIDLKFKSKETAKIRGEK